MAVARYHIDGKFNPSAIKSAQVQLKKLKKEATHVAVALQGMIAAKVMQIGSAAINGATDAFRNQELQVKRLTVAVQNNAALSTGAFERLQQKAGELSSAAIFSGEEITKNQAFLSSMKLNEGQINSVMKAATNMASAGVMPLDQAVKTLSKTYAGNAGKLKELNPAIANLTEAQLKSGAAVELTARQYRGFNEAVANSEHGKALRFANTFDDLKKTLGEIITRVKNIAFGHLLGPLQRVTQMLQQNKDKIINFFRYLPEIVLEAGTLARDILKKAFSWDFLWKTIKIALNFCWVVIKGFFNSYFAYIQLIGTVIWEPLKYGFQLVMYGIKQGFYATINYFIDKLNFLIEQANKIAHALGREGFGTIEKIGQNGAQKPENNIGANIKAAFDKALTVWTETGKDIASSFISSVKEIGGEFSEAFSEFGDKLDKILKRPAPASSSPQSSGADSGGQQAAAQQPEGGANPWMGLVDSAKEAGGAIGWMANAAMKAVEAGDPLAAVIEILNLVLGGIFVVLAPVVDSLLVPFFGMLRVLGKFIGLVLAPLLKALEPILRPLIKAFLFLYNNVLVPVGNGLIIMFNLIHNAIAGFINGVSSLVRRITFGAVDLGHSSYKSLTEGKLERISEQELNQEGRSALKMGGSGGATGNAAGGVGAAMAAKPTEIHINFVHSFVNGDAREIALMLRKEIQEAEKMGY